MTSEHNGSKQPYNPARDGLPADPWQGLYQRPFGAKVPPVNRAAGRETPGHPVGMPKGIQQGHLEGTKSASSAEDGPINKSLKRVS